MSRNNKFAVAGLLLADVGMIALLWGLRFINDGAAAQYRMFMTVPTQETNHDAIMAVSIGGGLVVFGVVACIVGAALTLWFALKECLPRIRRFAGRQRERVEVWRLRRKQRRLKAKGALRDDTLSARRDAYTATRHDVNTSGALTFEQFLDETGE